MSQAIACQTNGTATADKAAEERILNPRVDVAETETTLVLTADMPGVKEDDVDVTLHEQVLTIEANKHVPEFDDVHPAYMEHATGRYYRRFKVMEDIERDGIEATLKDGVLRVTLPKAKAQLAQKIKVLPA